MPPSVPGETFDDGVSQTNLTPHYPLYYRNTFHWGRSQFPNLSSSVISTITTNLTGALSNLVTADYTKAHLNHWLLGADEGTVSQSISSERDPSPDAQGQIQGLRTWYNYTGKPSPEIQGNLLVGCVARLLPDNSSQYVQYNYNPPGSSYGGGKPSNSMSSYTSTSPGISILTNWFSYASNSVDLLSVSNSAGQFVNLGFTTNHQVLAVTNSLYQVMHFGYDPVTFNITAVGNYNGQTVNISYYSGATSGTIYDTNSLINQVTIQPENRVISITDYTNSMPHIAHVTGIGVPDLWTTNTWDALNRLTGTSFQDGTTISNIYTYLDLGARKDRVGNWTQYSHDDLQHLVSITDALSNVTQFTWCECGSLTSISNALGHITYLNRNNQELLTNVTFPDNSSLNWQYDLSGRMTNRFDGLNNSQQFVYNNQNKTIAVNNLYGQLLGYYFDAAGRPLSVTNANGVSVNNSFDLINHLLSRSWPNGANEYFGYATNGLIAYTNQDSQWTHFTRDAASRVIGVANAVQTNALGWNPLDEWSSLVDGLSRPTTWSFNQYGWLTSKTNALGTNSINYTYDPNGRVANRWMMGTNTQYQFDAVGNLSSIIYPAFTNIYKFDAIKELTNMIDPSGTSSFTWTSNRQLASATSPWLPDTVSYGYSQGHRNTLSFSQPSGPVWSQTYNYDAAWRMTSITSPAGTFIYQYSSGANQYVVSGIILPNGAFITNQHDTLSRLTSTALVNYWDHTLDGYIYGLDALGLPTNITRQLGLTTNTVSISYDPIAEVTSWTAKEANGTARQNEQLSYAYDAANNVHLRTNNALVQTFTVDSLNQLSNVTRTGTLTISGALPAPPISVTVNGTNAQTNGDFTFASTNNTLTNGTNTFTIIAENVYGTNKTNTLSINLPATVTLQYDANGNLTNDGTRSFYFDAENRLTNVTSAGHYKAVFLYDGLGRRSTMTNYSWQSSAWVVTNATRYIYDGQLVIQERDTNNNVLVTYTHGMDLSGTLQGAGGIGGLLARTDTNGTTYYHCDGNGNITALIDGNQNIVARYEYDAYGRLIGMWGTNAAANVYRFSSKQYDAVTGLYYYGSRYYDPVLQRWLNHDPLQERFDFNLYRFNYNSPLAYVDSNGRNPLLVLFLVGAAWSAVMTPYNANAPGPNDATYPPASVSEILANGAIGGLANVATGSIVNMVDSAISPRPTPSPAPEPTPSPAPEAAATPDPAQEFAAAALDGSQAGNPSMNCPSAIPNATRLSAVEQATASRLLQAQPDLTLNESEDVGADFVDQNGQTYDAMGSPAASQYWNEEQFLDSLDSHLLKANDFTVVDLTGFTGSQISTIANYINSLPAELQAKIIKIGF
jgi:RHS repeat-associated protein